MALIVQKFGGSSVADRDRVMNVARIVAKTHADGNDVVVVVSAQGDTTDELIAKAGEITHDASQREMDMLMSAGEQISVALLSMALSSIGCRAISLTGWQAGFHTDRAYTRARIKRLDCERIESELSRNRVVVVAGFQGINKNDDITTLGRGGSDTSAVAIAAARRRPVPDLHRRGRRVHRRPAPCAKRARAAADIVRRNAGTGKPGRPGAEQPQRRACQKIFCGIGGALVAYRRARHHRQGGCTSGRNAHQRRDKNENVAVISLLEVPYVPGMSFNVFSLMAQKKINVGIILQASGRGNNKDLIFTVPLEDVHTAVAILEENLQRFGATKVLVDTDVAKVSIVGAGVQSHPGVAAKMFERLYECNINIRMIATSEIKISVIIAKQDADRAVAAVHEAFFQ